MQILAGSHSLASTELETENTKSSHVTSDDLVDRVTQYLTNTSETSDTSISKPMASVHHTTAFPNPEKTKSSAGKIDKIDLSILSEAIAKSKHNDLKMLTIEPSVTSESYTSSLGNEEHKADISTATSLSGNDMIDVSINSKSDETLKPQFSMRKNDDRNGSQISAVELTYLNEVSLIFKFQS